MDLVSRRVRFRDVVSSNLDSSLTSFAHNGPTSPVPVLPNILPYRQSFSDLVRPGYPVQILKLSIVLLLPIVDLSKFVLLLFYIYVTILLVTDITFPTLSSPTLTYISLVCPT